MLRRPIGVLLGLIDRAARAWVRWRGGHAPGEAVGDGPMQSPQPPADWLERVRRGAPGLLEPAGDDQLQVAPGAPESRSKEVGKLPEPPRMAQAGDAKPASPSATPKPAASRPLHSDVPPPRRRRGKRPATGDPGESRASHVEEAGPPAADDLLPGRPHLSQQQPTAPENAILLQPSATPVRAPAAAEPPAADSTPVISPKKTEPLSPVQPIPTRISAPISTNAAPRSIYRSDSAANRHTRSAKGRPSGRPAEGRPDSDSHRWPDLPDPPEEGGPGVEAALRKTERDRQVAHEQSRL